MSQSQQPQFSPDEVASARLREVGKVWTSDLSVAEYALLDAAGFEPLEFVMGSSVYHIGWQQQTCASPPSWPCSPRRCTPPG